jgi:hypothetical protein
MMNAGKFLVTTVHEIAISTKLAISTWAAEKTHSNALTNRPALNTGTKGIDASDCFVTGDARPIDGKQTFHRAGIGMTDSTGLNADAHLASGGHRKRSLDYTEYAWC